jgi:sugar O-acyltransferase (sialic acid O-acetyltransferase NeuD family)
LKNIIIFGSGDHAKVIFWELVEFKKYKIIGFFDYTKKERIVINYKNRIYKSFNSYKKINKISNLYGIIGLGTGSLRKEFLINTQKVKLNIKWEKFISKFAVIKRNVKLDDGCVILSGSHINSNSIIGKHVLINSKCNVEHDNIIDDFATLSPSVTTAGNVKIGSNTYVGMGSNILGNIIIKNNVIIGAGSLVNKNLMSKNIYFGSPAKKIRRITSQDRF